MCDMSFSDSVHEYMVRLDKERRFLELVESAKRFDAQVLCDLRTNPFEPEFQLVKHLKP